MSSQASQACRACICEYMGVNVDAGQGDCFSKAVGKLSQLTSLHFAEVLPDTVVMSDLHSLTLLKSLRLFSMELRSFEAAPAWGQLKGLSIACNDLVRVPDLSRLTCLTSIDCSYQSQDFQVTEPMHFLDHMPALRYLCLTRGIARKSAWSLQSLLFIADGMQRVRSLHNKDLTVTF